MSQPTSHSLIDAVKSTQDEERMKGWERLWAVYGDYVRYRIQRTGANENDLDDIAQDVMSSVNQRIANFTPGSRTGSFRKWLGKIIWHRVSDFYRDQAKCAGAGDASGRTDAMLNLADPGANPEDSDEAESDQVKRIYQRALVLAQTEFEETTVKMFRQAVAEGRATKDIAEEHGVSPAAVRMAKSRVLKRLRKLLGESDLGS